MKARFWTPPEYALSYRLPGLPARLLMACAVCVGRVQTPIVGITDLTFWQLVTKNTLSTAFTTNPEGTSHIAASTLYLIHVGMCVCCCLLRICPHSFGLSHFAAAPHPASAVQLLVANQLEFGAGAGSGRVTHCGAARGRIRRSGECAVSHFAGG